jgi:hypothetical protein
MPPRIDKETENSFFTERFGGFQPMQASQFRCRRPRERRARHPRRGHQYHHLTHKQRSQIDCSTRISAGDHSIRRLGHLVGTIRLRWIARFLQSN